MDIWSTNPSDSESLIRSRDRQSGANPSSAQGPRSVQGEENAPQTEVCVYGQRWYILFVFSMVAFSQGGLWNTWGPIAASSECAFGWTDATIALMANWGCITYIVSTPFLTWLMDVKGLRWSTLVVVSLTTVGMGLRCITSSTPVATYLIHAGQFLNGIGGPVAMGAAPLLSSTWFPADERTTATAIATVMNGIGVSVSFIIGPLLVPDVSNHTQCLGNLSLVNNNHTEVHHIRASIMRLMYYEFGFCLLLLLLVLIYFPHKPPKPPSVSASIQRVDFKRGVIDLFKHPKFWMLGIPYAVPDGFLNCWLTVLDVNVKPLGVSQDTAGWMGFFASLAGNVLGVIVAFFSDIFKRRMKLLVIVLYVISAAAFAVFTLVYVKIVPLSVPLLYASVVIGTMTMMGAVPLFFELTCESTYPIAEGVTNGFLTWLNNIPGLILLSILMDQNIGKAWTNWSLLGCIVASLPILFIFKERYSRLDIDTQVRKDSRDLLNYQVDSADTQPLPS